MKKYIFLLAFLMLTACGSEISEQELVQKYKSAPEITIEAEITAEFSDRADTYRVLYNYPKEKFATVKVLAPVEIAGIEAELEENGTVFKFKDAILETGAPLYMPSPMNIIHKLVRAWSFSSPSQYGKEGDNLLFVYEEGEYEYKTVFSENFVPVSAEIMQNSKLIMTIEFLNCEGIINDN